MTEEILRKIFTLFPLISCIILLGRYLRKVLLERLHKSFCFEMFREQIVDMKTVMEFLGNSEETLGIYVLKPMLEL